MQGRQQACKVEGGRVRSPRAGRYAFGERMQRRSRQRGRPWGETPPPRISSGPPYPLQDGTGSSSLLFTTYKFTSPMHGQTSYTGCRPKTSSQEAAHTTAAPQNPHSSQHWAAKAVFRGAEGRAQKDAKETLIRTGVRWPCSHGQSDPGIYAHAANPSAACLICCHQHKKAASPSVRVERRASRGA